MAFCRAVLVAGEIACGSEELFCTSGGPHNKSLEPTLLSRVFIEGASLLKRFNSSGVTLRQPQGG